MLLRFPLEERSIRTSTRPILGERPRSVVSPDAYKTEPFSWCITESDIEGEWTWGEPRQWSDNEYTEDIEGVLNGLLSNTWNEVETFTYNAAGGRRGRINKYQLVSSLCDEAQQRWQEHDKFIQYNPFRFRLNSNKRVWGIRVRTHFFTIWYERYHRICPPRDM